METKSIIIDYDFYKDYQDNTMFNKILTERIKYIQNKHFIKNINGDAFIEQYFVEIFSWTVLSKDLLIDLDTVINTLLPNYILLDPCSGNSFHTFLFNYYCNRDVITIDIQPDDVPWIHTIEQDGLSYLKTNETHKDFALWLSWIDLTDQDLSYNLLKSFKGSVIISVGNYREVNSKKYLDLLNNEYKLVVQYFCEMPWNLVEEIKVFIRLNE